MISTATTRCSASFRLGATVLLLVVSARLSVSADAASECLSGPADGQWTVQTTVTYTAPGSKRQTTEDEECTSVDSTLENNTTTPPSPVENGYKLIRGFGYYKLHKLKKIWPEAKETCEAEGGHLLIINSRAEELALKEAILLYLGSRDFVLIGINDIEEEGKFVTVQGEPLSSVGYANWSPGEPNNIYPGEDCGCIWRTGMINDFYCDFKRPFICEIPLRNTDNSWI